MMGFLRQMKPKTITDLLSFLYAQFLVHSTIIFGEFIVAPWMREYYGTTTFDIILYTLFGIFIYINVEGNLFMIMLTNCSTSGKVLPTLLKPGWQYCARCEANAPPRAFHCPTCDRCILKRDHHCMFSGKCIGYFNHRYYIMLIVYTWIGAMFCLTFSFRFLWISLGGFSLGNLVTFILPLVMFICGIIDFYTCCICFIGVIVTLFCVLLSVLMVWHSKHLYCNMTTFERRRNIRIYDIGWKENLISIFGTRWYVGWIFPFISSPLPGDGIEFPTTYCYENPKDL